MNENSLVATATNADIEIRKLRYVLDTLDPKSREARKTRKVLKSMERMLREHLQCLRCIAPMNDEQRITRDHHVATFLLTLAEFDSAVRLS